MSAPASKSLADGAGQIEHCSRVSALAPVLGLVLGATVMVLRVADGPVADWLAEHVAFDKMPLHSQQHVDDLLLVPAAAVLVVLCRVTLGLRMLGPFRPVLIALAFYQTGVVTGAAFLALVMVVVVLLRPRLGRGTLPYFGRLSVLLSVVVVVELVVLLLGAYLQSGRMIEAAVFPIVVLCLSADGFARVLAADGPGPAIWRGVVTVGLAAAISTLGSAAAVADFLYSFPEFVFVEIALIVWISTRMKWGWFASKKPTVESDTVL